MTPKQANRFRPALPTGLARPPWLATSRSPTTASSRSCAAMTRISRPDARQHRLRRRQRPRPGPVLPIRRWHRRLENRLTRRPYGPIQQPKQIHEVRGSPDWRHPHVGAGYLPRQSRRADLRLARLRPAYGRRRLSSSKHQHGSLAWTWQTFVSSSSLPWWPLACWASTPVSCNWPAALPAWHGAYW